jgi:midasin
MRTAADRKEVLQVFKEVFKVTPHINPYPRVQLNSDNLLVGNVAIKRNVTQFYTASSSHLLIQPKICQSLEAAALCVEHQWLCILVGPSCSGKTKLLRLLAALTGNVLNEVNLSSATDISELLGSFEQYDALRNYRTVVAQVEGYVNEYCSLQLEVLNGVTFKETDLYRRWTDFSSKFDILASASNYLENWRNIICSLSLLDEIIEKLKFYIEKNSLLLTYSIRDLDLVKHTILKLKANDQKRLVSTKFEWVTGLLIKAIERGEWIVLENANLCNPTVCEAYYIDALSVFGCEVVLISVYLYVLLLDIFIIFCRICFGNFYVLYFPCSCHYPLSAIDNIGYNYCHKLLCIAVSICIF